jgi:hypothetical protein
VNDASSLEAVWLNEGLSHIAEELVFYRAAGLSPGRNIDSLALRASPTILDAANHYQVSNLGRLTRHLRAPETSAPFADDDSLATRGAAWQLLRYAADRRGGDQGATWSALVNSRATGLANFAAVFGPPLASVRDWAVAQYTDDAMPNVPAPYTHPSWSFRGVLPLLASDRRFPLRTRPLDAGATQTLTLSGGGAAYLRFGVGANATATIRATSQGQALPAAVELILVRTR